MGLWTIGLLTCGMESIGACWLEDMGLVVYDGESGPKPMVPTIITCNSN